LDCSTSWRTPSRHKVSHLLTRQQLENVLVQIGAAFAQVSGKGICFTIDVPLALEAQNWLLIVTDCNIRCPDALPPHKFENKV
jgi:hypothetical protein